jgi:hypothetical protein
MSLKIPFVHYFFFYYYSFFVVVVVWLVEFFCGTRVLSQGLELVRQRLYHLNHVPNPVHLFLKMICVPDIFKTMFKAVLK